MARKKCTEAKASLQQQGLREIMRESLTTRPTLVSSAKGNGTERRDAVEPAEM